MHNNNGGEANTRLSLLPKLLCSLSFPLAANQPSRSFILDQVDMKSRLGITWHLAICDNIDSPGPAAIPATPASPPHLLVHLPLPLLLPPPPHLLPTTSTPCHPGASKSHVPRHRRQHSRLQHIVCHQEGDAPDDQEDNED